MSISVQLILYLGVRKYQVIVSYCNLFCYVILPISVSGMYMYLGIEGMLCSSLLFRFVSLSLLSMFVPLLVPMLLLLLHMCNAGSGVWIASYLLRVSCLMLEVNEFRYYEAKIEESEKAGSRQESNPGYLWLEPPVLCHWATTAWRPLTPTILYLYCTGGTIHFCTCSTDRGLWGLVVIRLSWLSGRVLVAQARGVRLLATVIIHLLQV